MLTTYAFVVWVYFNIACQKEKCAMMLEYVYFCGSCAKSKYLKAFAIG
jgi:hypothetical protein